MLIKIVWITNCDGKFGKNVRQYYTSSYHSILGHIRVHVHSCMAVSSAPCRSPPGPFDLEWTNEKLLSTTCQDVINTYTLSKHDALRARVE